MINQLQERDSLEPILSSEDLTEQLLGVQMTHVLDSKCCRVSQVLWHMEADYLLIQSQFGLTTEFQTIQDYTVQPCPPASLSLLPQSLPPK